MTRSTAARNSQRARHIADAHDVSRQLSAAAELLAAEFTGLPPGTVLRCFARAVREARAAGVPTTTLATEAEHVARVLLGLRTLAGPVRGGHLGMGARAGAGAAIRR